MMMMFDLVVVAEVCLSELDRREVSSGPGKSELRRDVAGTSDDVCDSLPTETVHDESRTTANQQQLLVV